MIRVIIYIVMLAIMLFSGFHAENKLDTTDVTDTTQVVTPAPDEESEYTHPVKLTATPTVKPTAKPTVKPAAQPTATPTFKPTSQPTTTPTVKPTAQPTTRPTSTYSPGEDEKPDPDEGEGFPAL